MTFTGFGAEASGFLGALKWTIHDSSLNRTGRIMTTLFGSP